MKTLESFELDQLYTLTMDGDSVIINDIARNEIMTIMLLYHQRMFNKILDIDSFSKEIEWKWMADRGSLPKRIAKWYRDTFHTKLPEIVITELGNLKNKLIQGTKTYYFDFTQNFTWDAGEFGDGRSCFWKNRSSTLDAMMNDGRFYAIRVFSEKRNTSSWNRGQTWYQKYTGAGRAWITLEKISIQNTNKMLKEHIVPILYNGYGIDTFKLAGLFSSFLNQKYKIILTSNKGNLYGGLYINEDNVSNGNSYIFGPDHLTSLIEHYDFNLSTDYDSKRPSKKSMGLFEFKDNLYQLKYDHTGTPFYGQSKRASDAPKHHIKSDKPALAVTNPLGFTNLDPDPWETELLFRQPINYH